jgi:hypothetical protein
MATVTPPGACSEATLEAACQLLHNPPGLHASPSVAEQWYHDVDQLVVAGINTMPHRGWQAKYPGGAPAPSVAHSRSPMAPRESAPYVPVASLTTADLRVELKRHRLGEDDRITIECCWERHCNLDRDFSAAGTTPTRQVARTPTSLMGSRGGCMTLAPYLCMVV